MSFDLYIFYDKAQKGPRGPVRRHWSLLYVTHSTQGQGTRSHAINKSVAGGQMTIEHTDNFDVHMESRTYNWEQSKLVGTMNMTLQAFKDFTETVAAPSQTTAEVLGYGDDADIRDCQSWTRAVLKKLEVNGYIADAESSISDLPSR